MTFLPVAQRELLAASRRKATFRMRVWTALFAAGLTFFMLLFVSITGAGAQSGRWLFYVLVSGGNLFAILAGVLVTADCLSEERRDGSLGFLFLTDLNGVDVVAGKFAGRALGALYGLTSVFPVIAISWFLGGISNGEFWRNCAVMLNQLFFASAVGLAVSAGEVRQARAVGRTLLVLAVFVLGMPLLAGGLLAIGAPQPWLWLTLPSPTQVFGTVRETEYVRNPSAFLWSLGISHATGWLFLLYASIVLGLNWRSGPEGGTRSSVARRLDRRWLTRAPIRALLAADRWPLYVAWGTVVLAALLALVSRWNFYSPYVLIGLAVVLKGLMAWEVTAFLGEARRTGALDLLMATPLRDDDFNRAIHAHLAGRYLAPILAIVACQYVSGFGNSDGPLAVVDSIGTLLQVLAVGSVGTWFGLTEPRPLMAFAKTFGLTILVATPLNPICCIGFVIPPLLGVWAQSKLRLSYREILAGVRSHWQRRDGWLHSTSTPTWTAQGRPGARPAPPPLPYQRDE